MIGNAVKVIRIAVGEEWDVAPDDGKNKAAQALGKLGGVAMAKSMTQKRREEIANKAASSRWGKEKRLNMD